MGWKEPERDNDDGISNGAFTSFNINAHHKFARIEQIKSTGHREEIEIHYNYMMMMKTLKEKSSTTLQMGFSRFIFFVLLELLWLKRSDLITDAQAVPLTRNSFPKGFTFGASSSAYQTEGGANEGGRGPSIWDTFTHQNPDNILDGSNGDVATDSYHRYKEDVGLMKDIGMDAYRFSISWSRILPKGKLRGGVNPEGIKYYDNLINELISKGIKPFVTLFHWDLPQALQDEYTGFLSPLIVNDFQDYAELCFKKFGDRVKHWITVNEPYGVSITGYSQGIDAPGRCSPWVRNCRYGDSGTEPYLVGHNLLLAHAAAVQLYRDKFQESQKGTIGITLAANWLIPYSDTSDDRAAQRRALDFLLGRFLNPLTFGTYPNNMKKLVGKRLPEFTEEEALMVKGSFDFLGLNYYSTSYVAHANSSNSDDKPTAHTDPQTIVTNYKDGIPLGIPDEQGSFFIVPEGLQEMLLYVKKKYGNPTIYITESGFDQFDNGTLPLEKALKDDLKMRYYSSHYQYSLKAIQKGVDLKGFFIWSFLDDFEWSSGYTNRFGLVYVDYNNGRKRLLKQSALWLKDFLNAGVQKQKQIGVADSK